MTPVEQGDYECHITLKSQPGLQPAIRLMGWSFSEILGDPQLGIGARSYATRHFSTKDEAIREVTWLAYHLSMTSLGTVLRCKVEHVIFDRRYPYGTDVSA